MNNPWLKITPVYEINKTVAQNPLEPFSEFKFETGITLFEKYFYNKPLNRIFKTINYQTIKWCSIIFSKGPSGHYRPDTKSDNWQLLKKFLISDTTLHNNNKKQLDFLHSLPDNVQDFIENQTKEIPLEKEDKSIFLELLLTTLPGWSGYVKHTEYFTDCYLALRLILFALIFPTKETEIIRLFKNYQPENQKLIKKIEDSQKNQLSNFTIQETISETNPDVQMIFCIDNRSEPVRHLLEKNEKYQTFGAAGFFNLLIGTTENNQVQKLCPPSATPETVVTRCTQKTGSSLLKAAYYQTKYRFSSPLSLAEGIGSLATLWMLIKTWTPQLSAVLKKEKKEYTTVVKILNKLTLEQKITAANALLTSIDLTNNFAKTIIITGHESNSENNTYQSTLQCGACCANSGRVNAQIMAAILNDSTVRSDLTVHIPKTTIFIAGIHNTSTDELVLFETDQLPTEYKKDLQTLKVKWKKVQEKNCSRRLEKLKIKTNNPVKKTKIKSSNWSDTRPEWGLANNTGFIIGNYQAIKNNNLDGRYFLHSYNGQKDTDGSILAGILNGPGIVTHTINSYYLYSVLYQNFYGAGDKVTHNISGKIGVMQGVYSDLKMGLAQQSVFYNKQTLYHQPAKLQVIIQAPESVIQMALLHAPAIKKYSDNNWIQLIRI